MVKTFNAIQAIDTTGLVKKAENNTRIKDIEKKIINHNKCITKNDSNKLMNENLVEILKQENLANKNYIANFVKNTDFDKKLIRIKKKVTSNKAKHAEAEKKLNDHKTSYTKLINDLLEKSELISTKRLTKDLINGFSILSGAKYFSEKDES